MPGIRYVDRKTGDALGVKNISYEELYIRLIKRLAPCDCKKEPGGRTLIRYYDDRAVTKCLQCGLEFAVTLAAPQAQKHKVLIENE